MYKFEATFYNKETRSHTTIPIRVDAIFYPIEKDIYLEAMKQAYNEQINYGELSEIRFIERS